MDRMKVAIHHRKGSFSDRWIEYLQEKNIPYVLLNAFDNDIIKQIKDHKATHFMWHFNQNYFEDMLHAKNLFRSVNQIGIKTYPNEESYWHFDDKVAQKYLLEALEVPLVKADVFYHQKEAEKYIEKTSFPKVFKLKGGAGSINVKLVKTKQEAKKLVNKAFNGGFAAFDSWAVFTDTIERFWRQKTRHNFLRILKWGFKGIFVDKQYKVFPKQRNYVYFQEFIPGLKYDIRLIVIGAKCYYLKRNTRDNDFRASGSGMLEFAPGQFNLEAVDIAFKAARKLNMVSVAYDFIFDSEDKPLMVEISYGFQPVVYDRCLGYYDADLNWHEAKVNLEYEIVHSFLNDF
ncbi:RimK family alpha-L-glutamate ligase [Chryseobacterium kwangjuense]|uniref:RimK family alpha-L-glutamate ligase n=1 Tax=Chryseobacterium kwangjuense TaxID=267125 RepID=A0ABW9JZQ6_9FLAO